MTAQASQKVFQRFTAVDLVTIAVFAALWRAMWYVWNVFAFLFPFNQVLNTFFGVLCTIAAYLIVRKVGTALLLEIAAMLINVLVQGEVFSVALVGIVTGVLPDLYCYIVLRAGRDPFSSLRDMFTFAQDRDSCGVVHDWAMTRGHWSIVDAARRRSERWFGGPQ